MRRDYSEERPLYSGVQRIFKFENGYGASVVRHTLSYGYHSDLWELAVLDENGELDYSTPITTDVIGSLTEEEVDELLTQIENLPSV